MSQPTITERIQRGEAAIAAARAQGRDVRDWETYLEELKRVAASEAGSFSLPKITGNSGNTAPAMVAPPRAASSPWRFAPTS